MGTIHGVIAALLMLTGMSVCAQTLPRAIIDQLPAGYEVVQTRTGDFNADRATDLLVVAAARDERKAAETGAPAPRRWLLAFLRRSGGGYDLAGKNPAVVFAADQGGQCDPFLEAGRLRAKGPDFTVENVVACGEHWTDAITFRYDGASRRFLFHRRVVETWRLNPSTREDAEALVRSSRTVTTAKRDKPVPLDGYRPQ